MRRWKIEEKVFIFASAEQIDCKNDKLSGHNNLNFTFWVLDAFFYFIPLLPFHCPYYSMEMMTSESVKGAQTPRS